MPSSEYEHTVPRLPMPRLARIPFSGEGCGDSAGVPCGEGGADSAGVAHGESGGGPLDLLVDMRLFDACGVRIAFSSRAGGTSAAPFSSLNLSEKVGDDLRAVAANRRVLLAALGAADLEERLVVPDQVHGADIAVVRGADSAELARAQAEARSGRDAIVCTCADVPVLLCFADCVPVVLVAPTGVFAVAHAGWRGALAGIPGATLCTLARESGCAPEECNAYIGPHIGACCYETSPEILARFTGKYGSACDAGARHLDLSAAVAASLRAAGADAARIVDAGICTSCNSDDYYSYRAHGGTTGRHGAYACKGGTNTWD